MYSSLVPEISGRELEAVADRQGPHLREICSLFISVNMLCPPGKEGPPYCLSPKLSHHHAQKSPGIGAHTQTKIDTRTHTHTEGRGGEGGERENKERECVCVSDRESKEKERRTHAHTTDNNLAAQRLGNARAPEGVYPLLPEMGVKRWENLLGPHAHLFPWQQDKRRRLSRTAPGSRLALGSVRRLRCLEGVRVG